MRVLLSRNFAHADHGNHDAGATIEVPEAIARLMIGHNHARSVEVAAGPPAGAETAEQSPEGWEASDGPPPEGETRARRGRRRLE